LTTYYDNSILIFNPLTGAESGTIDLSNYLYTSDNGTQNQYVAAEHMLLRGNKLFVSIDRARTYYGDVQPDKSMILVINTDTDTVEKAVEVSYSPRSLQVYGDYLYFVSMGDYSSPIGKIYSKILKAMRRGYNSSQYRDIVKKLRIAVENFAITTDIIVGFPGEDEESFQNTYNFLEEINPFKMHIFPFSPREGTDAALIKPLVDSKIVNRRKKALEKLNQQMFIATSKELCGQKGEVLVEKIDNNKAYGHLADYRAVIIKNYSGNPNELIQVDILKIEKDKLICKKINE